MRQHDNNYYQGKINTGALYILAILLLIIGLAFISTGPIPSNNPIQTGTEVVIRNNAVSGKQDRLQLYTFTAATITPPMSSVCKKGGINTNPERIIAYSPAHGTAVRSDGEIRVWLNGPEPFKVAPDENIIRGSGAIKAAGDRSALAPDGYIWAPALYILPNGIERGGRAFFPIAIQGSYDNGQIKVSYGSDPLPSNTNFRDFGRALQLTWNVADLGLPKGSHQLQIVAHDGAGGRAIGCFTIRIYDLEDPRTAIPEL